MFPGHKDDCPVCHQKMVTFTQDGKTIKRCPREAQHAQQGTERRSKRGGARQGAGRPKKKHPCPVCATEMTTDSILPPYRYHCPKDRSHTEPRKKNNGRRKENK